MHEFLAHGFLIVQLLFDLFQDRQAVMVLQRASRRNTEAAHTPRCQVEAAHQPRSRPDTRVAHRLLERSQHPTQILASEDLQTNRIDKVAGHGGTTAGAVLDQRLHRLAHVTQVFLLQLLVHLHVGLALQLFAERVQRNIERILSGATFARAGAEDRISHRLDVDRYIKSVASKIAFRQCTLAVKSDAQVITVCADVVGSDLGTTRAAIAGRNREGKDKPTEDQVPRHDDNDETHQKATAAELLVAVVLGVDQAQHVGDGDETHHGERNQQQRQVHAVVILQFLLLVLKAIARDAVFIVWVAVTVDVGHHQLLRGIACVHGHVRTGVAHLQQVVKTTGIMDVYKPHVLVARGTVKVPRGIAHFVGDLDPLLVERIVLHNRQHVVDGVLNGLSGVHDRLAEATLVHRRLHSGGLQRLHALVETVLFKDVPLEVLGECHVLT
mmetsp:Transcript_60923/g.107034  ORF Transcript_60923/g.107034 Transcript_60923/m.107034 type:complete len:440 (-) Transcript_60923:2648-3967(-)